MRFICNWQLAFRGWQLASGCWQIVLTDNLLAKQPYYLIQV